MNYALVFVGGGIGSVLRYLSARAGAVLIGPDFPAGTLFVNVVGSAVMGALAVWFVAKGQIDSPVRLFLATGVIGGFTTFSAFSLDTAVLWERGNLAITAGYVLASVLVSLAALFVGMAVSRSAVGL